MPCRGEAGRARLRRLPVGYWSRVPIGTRCSSWAARSFGSSGPTSSCWRCGPACRSLMTLSSSASPWSECGDGAPHGSGPAAERARGCPWDTEEHAPFPQYHPSRHTALWAAACLDRGGKMRCQIAPLGPGEGSSASERTFSEPGFTDLTTSFALLLF